MFYYRIRIRVQQTADEDPSTCPIDTVHVKATDLLEAAEKAERWARYAYQDYYNYEALDVVGCGKVASGSKTG